MPLQSSHTVLRATKISKPSCGFLADWLSKVSQCCATTLPVWAVVGVIFSHTNFSTNQADLLAAVDYMATRGMPPDLLIGHSFGAACSLSLAERVKSVQGVVFHCWSQRYRSSRFYS